MSYSSLLSIIILLLTIAQSARIIKAIELVRHGSRAPIVPVRFAQWDNCNELLQVGMRQQFFVGLKVRQRYMLDLGLIKQEYDPDEATFHSFNLFSRCLDSTYSQIAGIYQARGPELENEYQRSVMPPLKISVDTSFKGALPLRFQAIPIKTNYFDPNLMDAGMWGCPWIAKDIAYYQTTDIYRRVEARYNKTLRAIAALAAGYTYEEADMMNTCYYILDNIDSLRVEGWPVNATNFPPHFYHQCDFYRGFLFLYLRGPSNHSLFLQVGLQLHQVLHDFDQAIQGNVGFKFVLELEVDNHIIALLKVFHLLDLKNWRNPPFSATLSFELWWDEEKGYFVKTLYNLEPIKVRGCEYDCQYQQFKEKIGVWAEPRAMELCHQDYKPQKYDDVLQT